MTDNYNSIIKSNRKNLVAIIDSGCRGAILAESYSNHPQVDEISAFPGNDLMQSVAAKPVKCYPKIKLTDVKKIVKECKAKKVSLVDVCQDDAVASGLVNALRRAGIPTIGHTKEAGIIEYDKAWCRQFLQRIGLDEYQPQFHIFKSLSEGIKFLKEQPDKKWFVKAAGLAAGKGALAARNNKIAIERIKELKQRFPKASQKYLLEEWVLNDDGSPGEEFSYYALCKGKKWKFEGNYQDHKNVFDYDEGDNTGGMGSVSPTKLINPQILPQIKLILDKVVINMANDTDKNGNSREFSGDLYLGGIILKKKGKLQVKVLEFNARLGDPEAHSVLGVKTNRYDIAQAIIGKNNFDKLKIRFEKNTRIVLTGAAKGYPGDCSQSLGKEIFGLENIIKRGRVTVYGAGTIKRRNRYFVGGGRLFYLVGRGKNILEARRLAYEEMSQIYVEGNNLHFRTDIGWRDVERLRKSEY